MRIPQLGEMRGFYRAELSLIHVESAPLIFAPLKVRAPETG